jgi:hypothetical protein
MMFRNNGEANRQVPAPPTSQTCPRHLLTVRDVHCTELTPVMETPDMHMPTVCTSWHQPYQHPNLGRRSPVSAIGLMRGGKACAPVSALLAARSAFNTPTGLI